MNVNECVPRFDRWAAVLLGIAAAAACGKSTSTAPTTMQTVSAITFNATSVVVGTTVQGTVTLTAAAPSGGVTIALSSSNTAVATVPATITVAAGASTGAVVVTTIAQGSATITATLNGSSVTSPTLTATAGGALASLSLSASTVGGGNPVTGTVTPTGAA